MVKSSLRLLKGVILAVLFWLSMPLLLGAASYFINSGGAVEQILVDRAVSHLRILRAHCDDPDLQGVLDYTIRRYKRIGPFDVCVTCIPQNRKGWQILGCNNPLVPGITLDIEAVAHSTQHELAMLIVHEALHDYWPCLGHGHVTPRMEILERLTAKLQKEGVL